MAQREKQKSTRGIPRKSTNQARKAKYARYKTRATCFSCIPPRLFRSPAKRAAHQIGGTHSYAA